MASSSPRPVRGPASTPKMGRKKKSSYLERLLESDMVRPDAHPRANASVVPSPRALLLSRGGTRTRPGSTPISYQVTSVPTGVAVAKAAVDYDTERVKTRPATCSGESIIALDVPSRSMIGKGLVMPISPFTPRYPSRLRITGHSPLRDVHCHPHHHLPRRCLLRHRWSIHCHALVQAVLTVGLQRHHLRTRTMLANARRCALYTLQARRTRLTRLKPLQLNHPGSSCPNQIRQIYRQIYTQTSPSGT